MVASSTWTDPKSGANYAFGDRLSSDDFNSWIGGIRQIDENAVTNAIKSLTSVDLNMANPWDAVWDSTTGRLIIVGGTGGAAPTTDLIGDSTAVESLPTAGTLTALSAATTNGSGKLITGGSVSGATAAKIRSSVDGGLTWTNRSLSASNDHNVQALGYINSTFVAFAGGGTGTATVESSADGYTWTSRTNPASNTGWSLNGYGGIESDGTTLVCCPSASSSTIVYTTNGTTFSTAAMSAATTWRSVAYTATYGWVAMSLDGATVNQSQNGTTWSVATTATAPTGVAGIRALGAIANVYVVAWVNADSDSMLSYSVDGCATWVNVGNNTENRFGLIATTGNKVVWIGNSGDNRILTSVAI